MNYIDELAVTIYRQADPHTQPRSKAKPPKQDMPLYRMYALLALAKGEATTAEDVHDAWSGWMAGLNPKHRNLIPFDELAAGVQRLDEPYVEAIHAAAREMRRQKRADEIAFDLQGR